MSKKIKVILGSVRTSRAGKAVADWVMKAAERRDGNFQYELIDLKTVNLPWYDEPVPPKAGVEYVHETTREWSRIISESDGFVFVTPEYNHGCSPALKNAIDHLLSEWKGKPVVFVGYGAAGAQHAIRQLREILVQIKMNPLEAQVGINKIWAAFDNNGNLKQENISGDINERLSELEGTLLGESPTAEA